MMDVLFEVEFERWGGGATKNWKQRNSKKWVTGGNGEKRPNLCDTK